MQNLQPASQSSRYVESFFSQEANIFSFIKKIPDTGLHNYDSPLFSLLDFTSADFVPRFVYEIKKIFSPLWEKWPPASQQYTTKNSVNVTDLTETQDELPSSSISMITRGPDQISRLETAVTQPSNNPASQPIKTIFYNDAGKNIETTQVIAQQPRDINSHTAHYLIVPATCLAVIIGAYLSFRHKKIRKPRITLDFKH